MDYIIKLRLMSKISNLINIISRVISNESHSTALKNINEVFRDVDLQHIYKQQDPGSQEKLKIAELKKDISLKIKKSLGIDDKLTSSKDEVNLAINFLREIDFFDDDYYYLVIDGHSSKIEAKILTQPGLRTEQMKIAFDEIFSQVKDITKYTILEYEKKVTSSILGIILEEFIRLELRKTFPNCFARKLKWYNSTSGKQNKQSLS